MSGMRPRHAVLSILGVLLLLGLRFLTSSTTRTASPRGPVATSAPQDRATARESRDVPVPQSCTPDVNQHLADLIAQQAQGNVDNVMVCGVTISPSRTQAGGRHGSHQVLPLLASLPGQGSKLVEVVTNDDLDGVVTAPKGAQVFAYGQAFFDGGRFVAGIHDVHCATHRGADNGWVVVNGQKAPPSCGM